MTRPGRRRTRSGEPPPGSPSTSSAKKQRVTQACNPCRIAREKCNGATPVCGRCTAADRTCSYAPASRKRGLRSGYLRTLELSVAWLFEQLPESEETMCRFLTESSRPGDIDLLKKGHANPQLHHRWYNSRFFRKLNRILSDDPRALSESPFEESGTSQSMGDELRLPDRIPEKQSMTLEQDPSMNLASGNELSPDPRRLELPRDWLYLLDIHHSYTHCWLPIVDKGQLFETAALYPFDTSNLDANSDPSGISQHAELWIVLAVAALQDPAGPSTPQRPERLYKTARALLFACTSLTSISHARALLLHSLILIGQNSVLDACAASGAAARIVLQAVSERSSRLSSELSELLAASFILDTFFCLQINQPTVMRAEKSVVILTRNLCFKNHQQLSKTGGMSR